MKYKCDLCGETMEIYFEFKGTGMLGFTWKFCYDCGERIRDNIKNLEKKTR